VSAVSARDACVSVCRPAAPLPFTPDAASRRRQYPFRAMLTAMINACANRRCRAKSPRVHARVAATRAYARATRDVSAVRAIRSPVASRCATFVDALSLPSDKAYHVFATSTAGAMLVCRRSPSPSRRRPFARPPPCREHTDAQRGHLRYDILPRRNAHARMSPFSALSRSSPTSTVQIESFIPGEPTEPRFEEDVASLHTTVDSARQERRYQRERLPVMMFRPPHR